MREPVISDAVVEAACRAYWKAHGDHYCWPDDFTSDELEYEREIIAATITSAILADRAETIEACAKVAEDRIRNWDDLRASKSAAKDGKIHFGGHHLPYDSECWAIASSIRSMGAYKPGKETDGE